MKKLLLYLWQLPQSIVGYCILFFCKIRFIKSNEKVKKIDVNGIKNVYSVPKFFNSAVSLNIIIGQSNNITQFKTCMHEYGHRIQSQKLGPLYLIIIGIPSFLGNLKSRLYKKCDKYFDYYKQPWEAWADKLGGVKR